MQQVSFLHLTKLSILTRLIPIPSQSSAMSFQAALLTLPYIHETYFSYLIVWSYIIMFFSRGQNMNANRYCAELKSQTFLQEECTIMRILMSHETVQKFPRFN